MDAQDTFFSQGKILDCGGKKLDLSKPAVMGILNVTPDSFFDGGLYSSPESALLHAREMVRAGAAIIDVGACSTRPGSAAPGPEEEWGRLLPVLELLRSELPEAVISVDTYRPEVAAKAIAAGAGFVNDISGGTMEGGMAELVAANNVPYVLMHIKGTPADMQNEPQYAGVVQEVADYFRRKIAELEKAGARQIILDPGFGFGKNVAHNFELLARLDEFVKTGYPVLAGMSRKSMLNKLLGISKNDSLNATTAVNTVALLKGASILRVHDVKEAVETIKIAEALKYST
ncbi:MAG: dihydropteroate synthase [Bacteroidetes bacterium]|nr:MAG: dihydropteroate synthase [Bacteroidota bacterium]